MTIRLVGLVVFGAAMLAAVACDSGGGGGGGSSVATGGAFSDPLPSAAGAAAYEDRCTKDCEQLERCRQTSFADTYPGGQEDCILSCGKRLGCEDSYLPQLCIEATNDLWDCRFNLDCTDYELLLSGDTSTECEDARTNAVSSCRAVSWAVVSNDCN